MKPLLEAYFPPMSGVSVIAEPGSFYVSSTFTLAVNVIGKEVVARDLQDQLQGEWSPPSGQKSAWLRQLSDVFLVGSKA